MKKLIFLLLVILAISPVLGDLPTKYNECNISVNIDENGIAYEKIIISVPKIIDKFHYYIIHRVKNLELYDKSSKLNCNWKYERTGTLISCENINTKIINISFNYPGLVTQYEDYNIFSDRYIVSTPTEEFNLKICLPKGYILVDNSGELNQSPYYPINGKQGTDGRNIFIEWNSNPRLGEIYDVSIFYEPALTSNQFTALIITFFVLIVMMSVFLIFRKKPKPIDYGITKDEKRFLEILAKENKVSQKKISREINLSKAQVSRIAHSLEKRGLIDRKRIGRNYEVSIKKN
ncbi:MAG: hypothetical protein DRP06_01895 [Candidatus Aenigmatarchaeota archaeon]|nr:MAG: hypothetical protein DRP06_01895 [Candidatus Aenigmarchaeota archaeon]